MRDFLKGDRCRREVILEHFGEQPRGNIVKHNCCDVCAAACACLDGGCQDKSDFEITLSKALTSSKSSGAEELLLNIPTAKSVDKLRSALEDYRISLLGDDLEHLYCGTDLSCGFSKGTVEKIVRDCNVQFDYDSLYIGMVFQVSS